MRSLLRWISLAATVGVLYALGVRGFHHRHFDVFLIAVLGVAIGIAVVIFATSTGKSEE